MTKTIITTPDSAMGIRVHTILSRLLQYKEVVELPFAIRAVYYATEEEIRSKLTAQQLRIVTM